MKKQPKKDSTITRLGPIADAIKQRGSIKLGKEYNVKDRDKSPLVLKDVDVLPTMTTEGLYAYQKEVKDLRDTYFQEVDSDTPLDKVGFAFFHVRNLDKVLDTVNAELQRRTEELIAFYEKAI